MGAGVVTSEEGVGTDSGPISEQPLITNAEDNATAVAAINRRVVGPNFIYSPNGTYSTSALGWLQLYRFG